MVFDDNQDAAETLAMALELFAREVVDAHPDAQAFELVGIADPTLTVLDISLPHNTGYRLGAAHATAAQPWIAHVRRHHGLATAERPYAVLRGWF